MAQRADFTGCLGKDRCPRNRAADSVAEFQIESSPELRTIHEFEF